MKLLVKLFHNLEPISCGGCASVGKPANGAENLGEKDPQQDCLSYSYPYNREPSRLEAESVELARQLISIDTSNYGNDDGPGERAAAEMVCTWYDEIGLDYQYIESAPRRASVLTAIEGTDTSLPPLLLHGHLDVVPAVASDWQVDPFAGVVENGLLWGRGAVDMKNMDGMIIALLRDMKRNDWRPRRSLLVAMMADEEHGGKKGAHYLVDNHRDFFADCTQAISEVGGFSVDLPPNGRESKRVYLVQCAEKGLSWLRLLAKGQAGHGSQVNEDNAVTALANAISRIGQYKWPLYLTPTVQELLQGVAQLTGLPFDPQDEDGLNKIVAALGPAKRFVGATLRSLANPTTLQAGYKCNVIPGSAEATVDLRYLPGQKEMAYAQLAQLAGPQVEISPVVEDVALEVPFQGELVDKMIDAIAATDPQATVLPYMCSAGTDAKAFSRLGIIGYGFVPLQLPPGLDFPAMFHGVDERIAISALHFGARTLKHFVQSL